MAGGTCTFEKVPGSTAQRGSGGRRRKAEFERRFVPDTPRPASGGAGPGRAEARGAAWARYAASLVAAFAILLSVSSPACGSNIARSTGASADPPVCEAYALRFSGRDAGMDTIEVRTITSAEAGVYLSFPDVTPPSGSVAINKGARATASATVTLTLAPNDAENIVTGMMISNDGQSYTSEIAYAASYPWTLAEGDGEKTVYVLFKDSAGNWMTYPAVAGIVLTLDTDGDGLPDAWERGAGLDPYGPGDAVLDRDQNGETNLDEYLRSRDSRECGEK